MRDGNFLHLEEISREVLEANSVQIESVREDIENYAVI